MSPLRRRTLTGSSAAVPSAAGGCADDAACAVSSGAVAAFGSSRSVAGSAARCGSAMSAVGAAGAASAGGSGAAIWKLACASSCFQSVGGTTGPGSMPVSTLPPKYSYLIKQKTKQSKVKRMNGGRNGGRRHCDNQKQTAGNFAAQFSKAGCSQNGGSTTIPLVSSKKRILPTLLQCLRHNGRLARIPLDRCRATEGSNVRRPPALLPYQ